MTKPKQILAVAALVGVGAVAACTPEEIALFMAITTGSGDVGHLFAAVILGGGFPLAKAAPLHPDYVVHYGEIDPSTHTCTLYMATDFGESTGLVFGYKANKKSTKFKVDKKAPTPTAAAFVKERLEELSTQTFTVTWTKVTGGAKVPKTSSTVPMKLTVKFKATVDSGPSAGTAFNGKLTYAGDLGDFASN